MIRHNIISEFTTGETISLDLILKEAVVQNTSAGKPYLSCTFTDGTSEIRSNVWDWHAAVPTIGPVYTVTGSITEFAERQQIKIKEFAVADNQDTSRFEPQCLMPQSAEYYYNKCLELIDQIPNQEIRKLVALLYVDKKEGLIHGTAAKGIHHAGHGGLIFHLYDTAMHAVRIYNNCTQSIPLPIDFSLVLGGALVHDIGKPDTYKIEGALIDMTLTGRLMEHLAHGAELVRQAAKILGTPQDTVELLVHIVLSHHGKLEYGSPVCPCFMEAHIVNLADGISATLQAIAEANVDAPASADFTNKIFVCGNVQHLKQTYVAELLNK